jgi:hypothetical protein
LVFSFCVAANCFAAHYNFAGTYFWVAFYFELFGKCIRLCKLWQTKQTAEKQEVLLLSDRPPLLYIEPQTAKNAPKQTKNATPQNYKNKLILKSKQQAVRKRKIYAKLTDALDLQVKLQKKGLRPISNIRLYAY